MFIYRGADLASKNFSLEDNKKLYILKIFFKL